MSDTKELISLAIAVAKRAGKIQKEGFGKDLQIGFKRPKDLITEIDNKCEKAIFDLIQERYPDHGILAEESGAHNIASPYRWIIDPLDGTTNYAHGYPCFCVSIAFEKHAEIFIGVVYNPILDELFWAIKNEGAWMNNQPIAVSKTKDLEYAVLATGGLTKKREDKNILFGQIRKLAVSSQALRIDGSAALDMCYVAKGRYDGFWEFGLSPWDTAAGSLIVKEAGGHVTTFSGERFDISGSELLTSNGLIHNALVDSLK